MTVGYTREEAPIDVEFANNIDILGVSIKIHFFHFEQLKVWDNSLHIMPSQRQSLTPEGT
jgi:hypothetical protein